jgi:hypothetical protein
MEASCTVWKAEVVGRREAAMIENSRSICLMDDCSLVHATRFLRLTER